MEGGLRGRRTEAAPVGATRAAPLARHGADRLRVVLAQKAAGIVAARVVQSDRAEEPLPAAVDRRVDPWPPDEPRDRVHVRAGGAPVEAGDQQVGAGEGGEPEVLDARDQRLDRALGVQLARLARAHDALRLPDGRGRQLLVGEVHRLDHVRVDHPDLRAQEGEVGDDGATEDARADDGDRALAQAREGRRAETRGFGEARVGGPCHRSSSPPSAGVHTKAAREWPQHPVRGS